MATLTQTVKRFLFSWATLLLLIVIMTPRALFAQTVFTDVKLIGHSIKSQINSLKQQYQSNGWTVIDKDLNASASGDYIYLLYKSKDALEANSIITDFYIKTGRNPDESIVVNGRTFRLVPTDGSSEFKSSKGDLNRGAAGDYIYLYYTEEYADTKAVTNVIFNDTKSGALGANGSSTGYDLNAGCGSGTEFIYMHVNRSSLLTLGGSGVESDPYLIQNNTEWLKFAKRISLGFEANKFYRLTNNIDVNKPAGVPGFPFRGNFEGFGKTINVSINQTEQMAAPFRELEGARIRNLNVTGTVTSSGNHASGLVGCLASNKGQPNYILNCKVNVAVNGSSYAGGLVGHGGNGTLTLRDCTFNGSISGFNKFAGGLVGWCEELDLNINNCLFMGTFAPASGGLYHPIACRWNEKEVQAYVINAYYDCAIVPSVYLADNAIPGVTGTAVSKTKVTDSYDYPVVAADGQTYYMKSSYSGRFFTSCDFENGLNGWTVKNGNGETGVKVNVPTSTNTGNNCFFFGSHTQDQYLISPQFDTMSALRFEFFFRGDANEKLNFQIGYSKTTNDTGAFTWLDAINMKVKDWSLIMADLPAGTKYVAFKCLKSSAWMTVDDISVYAPYPDPVNISMSDLTETSVTFNWEAPAQEAVYYLWKYKKTGADAWIKEGSTLDTSVSLTGLEENTQYVFYVQAQYADGRSSNYLTCTFTTLIPTMALPYYEGFENELQRWGYRNFADGTGRTKEVNLYGQYSFMFNPSSGPQYLQSPRIPDGVTTQLRFCARAQDLSHPATLGVGYLKYDGTSYVFPNGYSIKGSEWYDFSYDLPEGVEYAFIIWVEGGKLYLDEVSFNETVSVEFTKEGYATYFDSKHNIILPPGMKARVVTGVEDSGKVDYMTLVDGYNSTLNYALAEEGVDAAAISSGTPVLLQVEESDAPQSHFILLDNPTSPYTDTNYLRGSDTETTTSGGNFYYRLKYSQYGTDLGWYWVSNGGSAFTCKAHEAWLALPSSLAKSRLFMPLPMFDDPTGLRSIDNGQPTTDEKIYNLSGQQLNKLQKGINIINGKKVLIK